MAVSKKACPKAVGRNRIRRLIRESFRTQVAGQATAGKLQGEALDFVVLPTPLAASQSNGVLTESLSAHWLKLTTKATGRKAGH